MLFNHLLLFESYISNSSTWESWKVWSNALLNPQPFTSVILPSSSWVCRMWKRLCCSGDFFSKPTKRYCMCLFSFCENRLSIGKECFPSIWVGVWKYKATIILLTAGTQGGGLGASSATWHSDFQPDPHSAFHCSSSPTHRGLVANSLAQSSLNEADVTPGHPLLYLAFFSASLVTFECMEEGGLGSSLAHCSRLGAQNTEPCAGEWGSVGRQIWPCDGYSMNS